MAAEVVVRFKWEIYGYLEAFGDGGIHGHYRTGRYMWRDSEVCERVLSKSECDIGVCSFLILQYSPHKEKDLVVSPLPTLVWIRQVGDVSSHGICLYQLQ